MKDLIGNELKVGDFVVRNKVYVKSRYLEFALIVEAGDKKKLVTSCTYQTRPGVIRRPNYLLKFPVENIPSETVDQLIAQASRFGYNDLLLEMGVI